MYNFVSYNSAKYLLHTTETLIVNRLWALATLNCEQARVCVCKVCVTAFSSVALHIWVPRAAVECGLTF